MTLREFTAFVRVLWDNQFNEDATDEAVQERSFKKRWIVELACGYIEAVARNPDINGGVMSKNFKVGALRCRAAYLWYFSQWELGSGMTEVWQQWALLAPAQIHSLTIELGLEIARRQ